MYLERYQNLDNLFTFFSQDLPSKRYIWLVGIVMPAAFSQVPDDNYSLASTDAIHCQPALSQRTQKTKSVYFFTTSTVIACPTGQ